MVEEAAAAGLAAISLTDHDVLEGLAEAADAARELGVECLPGVELTADWDGRTVHILGHGIDPDDGPLRAALDRGRRLMHEHVERVLTAIQDAGESLVAADLDKYRARYAGGASLVLAMVERGVLRRVPDGPALLRLASQEPRAYSAAEAIELIHAASGIASLAHPIKVRPGMRTVRGSDKGAVREPPLQVDQLRPLVEAGLDGLEIWQIVHDDAARRHFTAVADELGLLRVGGSDCHGPRRSAGPRIGSQRVPYAVFEDLRRAIAARRDARTEPA